MTLDPLGQESLKTCALLRVRTEPVSSGKTQVFLPPEAALQPLHGLS